MMTTADVVVPEREQVENPLELTNLKGTGWWAVVSVEVDKPYFVNLCSFLKEGED